MNLHKKSFLKLVDYTTEEINYLINLSLDLKAAKKANKNHRLLEGKSVALLFQKDSTRTRCSFEVASYDLGMKAVYLGPSGSQFGKKESVEDSAKVLGRMFDGIQFRGYKQDDVEMLAKHSGVPVWNGLTDEWHPTQMIGDFMTIKEHKGKGADKDIKGLKMVYVGDARNNMANSLMITSAKLGLHFTALAPHDLQTEDEIYNKAQEICKKTGGSVHRTDNIEEATKDADILYTDVWVSMGETDWTGRLSKLHNYQINMKMLNNAKSDAIFMHCLPAFHDLHTTTASEKATEYGKDYPNIANGEFEVTDEVFRSKHSVVFDEAENRLHSIKAIMLATMLDNSKIKF